jgi:hypothetical protein
MVMSRLRVLSPFGLVNISATSDDINYQSIQIFIDHSFEQIVYFEVILLPLLVNMID